MASIFVDRPVLALLAGFSAVAQVALAGFADSPPQGLMRKHDSNAGLAMPYEEVDSQLAAFAAASLAEPIMPAESSERGRHDLGLPRAKRKSDGLAAVALEPSGEVSSASLLETQEAASPKVAASSLTVAVEADAFAKAWEDASDSMMDSRGELQLAGSLLEMERDVVNTTSQGDRESHRMSGLFAWAKRHGIRGLENLKVAHFPKGPDGAPVLGLALQRPVKKGDVLLKVPSHLVLWSQGNTTKSAFRTAGVPTPVVNEGGLDPLLRLCAGLLALRQQAFPTWEGWIRSLPTLADYREYHPMTATAKLLGSFEELPLSQRVHRAQRTRDAQLNLFQELGGIASGDDWQWAHLVVTSRCWSHRDRAGRKGLMIVPVADFLNSGSVEEQNVIAHIGDPDRGEAFVYTARSDLPAGSELIGYHSPASESDDNSESWGFVLDRDHHPVWTTAPPHLSRETCSKLSPTISDALGESGEKKCRPPAAQLQKGVYCTFAHLAAQNCEPTFRRLNTSLRLALILCGAAAAMLLAAPAVSHWISSRDEGKESPETGPREAEKAAKKPAWTEDLSTPKEVKEPPHFLQGGVEELYQLLYGEEAAAAREAHSRMAAAAIPWAPPWLRGEAPGVTAASAGSAAANPWTFTPHATASAASIVAEQKR
eukprot:TRINITY_DN74753_c0_g1_i1.p1 TRINITY_DN74753_c0_g1~~TRINITY_DN74753_c0_g1_i1.p1  ORF type:complete len:709 (-),score=134.64 TRINITY_DN74753_c0_g1_i1:95-2059(-)